ncbi:unnamed protein product [Auanema sp. JU1783]|nr:unnamed protein product [Auanema sp. JU1783]
MSHYQFTTFETPTPEPESEYDDRPLTASPTMSFRRDYATTTFQGRPMLYRINPELGLLCWLQEDITKESENLLLYGADRGESFVPAGILIYKIQSLF